MTTLELGNKLVELINAQDMATIYGTLYSPEIVSVESEAGGGAKEYVGMEAINAKNEWWASTFDVHSWKTEGPFPNGDQFALIFTLDITHKESGHRSTMHEVAVYTVNNGQIVHERFFYTQ